MSSPGDGGPGEQGSRPRARAPAAGSCYALAAFLLLLSASAALAASLGFVVGVPMTRLHLAVAVVAAAVATRAVGRAEGLPPRAVAAAIAVGLAALGAAAAAGHLAWDFSYDGQAYHQTAIVQLVRGWNPVARPLPPEETRFGIWLDHYVRGGELGAAAVAAATGSLEAGKALGLLLLAPATIFSFAALRRAGARPGPAAAGAVVAGPLNPVVLTQLATFYIDGQLALLFACSLALAWLSLRGRVRTAPILLAVALGLLANVKFTGAVYAAALLAGYLAAARRRRARPGARRGWVVAVAAACTLAIGWQPLVTNVAEHGHPFYPLAGAGALDVLPPQTPQFRHRDPVRRFLASTFSESDPGRGAPIPKLPFVVRRGELAAMRVADVRIGGFGPLFALALVLAALGAAALPWSRRSPKTRAGLLVAAGVLGTAAVNPAAWWARYVPQVWIAAALAALALAAARRRGPRVLGMGALAVLAANALVVGTAAAYHEIATQGEVRRQAEALARRSPEVEVLRGDMESIDLRLAHLGLRAREVSRCARPLPLVGTFATYCDVVGSDDAEQARAEGWQRPARARE